MSQRSLITKPPINTNSDSSLVLVTDPSKAALILETPRTTEQQSPSYPCDAGEDCGRKEQGRGADEGQLWSGSDERSWEQWDDRCYEEEARC